jgi:hypothetical protein
MKHTPNKKQIEAFNDVIIAMEKAIKLGLNFYGKQNFLVAYTKNADNYINKYDFEKTLTTGNKVVPYLQEQILNDSGADDYSCYISKEDELKYL